MRCRECGLEVDNDKAFCPVCGAPMKVTADYEYIQAEIANKVDRFFNEEANGENEDVNPVVTDLDLFIDPSDDDDIPAKKKEDNLPGKAGKNKKNRKSQSEIDDFAKTKNIYGSDSIFEDTNFEEDVNDYIDAPEEVYEPRKPKNYPENRKRPPKRNQPRRNTRPVPRDDYYEPKDQTAAKVITVLIIFVIIAACAVGVMAITGVFRPGNNNGGSTVQTVSSLTSNIVPGETYDNPVEVTLTSIDDDTIFYTLDGTEPSFNSKMYNGPFQISATDVPRTYPTVNLRAVSFSEDSEKSGDLNISFEFVYDEAFAPVIETETERVITSLEAPQIVPESGDYSSDVNITVVSPDGVDIYYTYDGTIPRESSNRYTGPVKMIPGSSTFRAVCIHDGIQSDESTAEYYLDYGYPISAGAAMGLIYDTLIWNGYIADYDGNTYDGGHADIKHLGVYTIGDYTYYMIETDIFNAEGNIQETLYFGVGINYGSVSWAQRDGSSFTMY